MLKITEIKTELTNRLQTITELTVRSGYFAMFSEINSRLAVIQMDGEAIESRNELTYKASRSLYIVLAVPMKQGAFDELEQLLFDTRKLLFTQRDKTLNGLAVSIKTTGEAVFEPAKSGNFITATIPVAVVYIQPL